MAKTYPKRKALSAKAAEPSKAAVALQNSFRFLLFLAQRYPMLLWTGAWLVLVLVSWLAIAGLTYTNPDPLVVESPQPETAVQPAQPQPEFQPRKPATSLGLIVGVVGICAVTSGLLARQLRPVKPAPSPVLRRTKATSIAAKAPANAAVVQPVVNLASVEPNRPETTPPKVTQQAMPPKLASTSQSAKQVSTVAAGKPSSPRLVELIDIRKQDSVASR